MTWKCIACGVKDESRREPAACRCGIEGSWELELGEHASKLGRAVRADELEHEHRERVSSGDAKLDEVLLGGWALGSSALVSGDGGSGKSRLCSRWAALAGSVLVAALEMPAELAADTAESAGADRRRIYLVDHTEGLTGEAERLGVRAVVVDSVSACARPVAFVRELAEWARRKNVLVFFISHQNRRGKARGDGGIEYWPDYVVRVRPVGKSGARVLVRKSRYCPRGSAVLELLVR